MTRKTTTKQQLLEATLKLISEKGYLGATTREISRLAGVTELTLFRHFGTKERLFEELLNSYTFLPRLKEILPAVDQLPYEDALSLIAMNFLMTLTERKLMIKILLTEIHLYPEKIRNVYSAMVNESRATLGNYFTTLQKKGVMRSVPPESAVRAFMGMLFNYFRTEIMIKENGVSKKRMEQNVREFVDIFIHGTMKHH
ncbi:MAG TPA: TetR/AcrR family transcriptional regulator [Nitrospirota bacterium]|nr:TetR/AcrR family transcriptional regulator [Nitrospirota bacterium]